MSFINKNFLNQLNNCKCFDIMLEKKHFSNGEKCLRINFLPENRILL